eukprot:TRINITY_DN28750_c0_g1_i1.p1 TRINITY_DN28750_c0_g1~~TRINITY_DN28750_c0_g1_i1.p1  ORF type:complete len:1108 (-),score=186.98 TRINITY_DN28750_c0_g1_i1:44-3367(-)
MAKGKVLKQAKEKKKAAPKDFQKQVNKVGKKKMAARNETKVDYTVKRIQMPSQTSVLEEKGEEVTYRKLGLLELLGHTQHHSGKVRRDAYRGLQELCGAHAGVLRSNLARILDACVTAAIDSNQDVRAAFRAFQGWLLKELPHDAVAAFAPTLALHVRSALSHVSAEIRQDGLLLLQLYLEHLGAGRVLSQTEASRVIDTLCQINSQSDLVLDCLIELLKPPVVAGAGVGVFGPCAVESDPTAPAHGVEVWVPPPQISLHAALDGRLHDQAGAAPVAAAPCVREMAAEIPPLGDSPVWGFCIRSWLQAGDFPGPGGGGRDGSSKPGLARLRCSAVLERALDTAQMLGGFGGDGAALPRVASLRPSEHQFLALVGIVRRGEWPLQTDVGSNLRPLADTVNLRMSRVLILLACGGAPPGASNYHVSLLARAALNCIAHFCETVRGVNIVGLRNAQVPAATRMSGGTVSLVLGGAASVAHSLRSLDLLWCCSPAFHTAAGISGSSTMGSRVPKSTAFIPVLHDAADHLRLTMAVSQLLDGGVAGGAENDVARAVSSPALLALPLAASLLGMRPTTTASTKCCGASLPPLFGLSWPMAMASMGEPCLAGVVEEVVPGIVRRWVTAWPKLLWYLGPTEPAVSSFLLDLLLELAKQAARAGSLFETLFREVCPMFLPFLVGLSGTELPPVARLPASSQTQAAAVVAHFPRLRPPIVARLGDVLCRWSDIGIADGAAESTDKSAGSTDAPPVGLHADYCECLLDTMLRFRGASTMDHSSGVDANELLQARLRISFDVVCATSAGPPASAALAAKAEGTALRLCDTIAAWLMGEGAAAVGAIGDGRLSYDSGRRLALRSLAWLQCRKALALSKRSHIASRIVCFFFFCAARVPLDVGVATVDEDAETADWTSFLREVFDVLVVRDDGRSLCPDDSDAGIVSAVLDGPLCHPARLVDAGCGNARKGGDGRADIGSGSFGTMAAQAIVAKRLAQMLTATWFRALPNSLWSAAYELLVKLCLLQFAAASSASQLNACAQVLAAAITVRNERRIPTDTWGVSASAHCLDQACVGELRLGDAGPKEVREAVGAQLQRLGDSVAAVSDAGKRELTAVLQLL